MRGSLTVNKGQSLKYAWALDFGQFPGITEPLQSCNCVMGNAKPAIL